MSELKRKIVRMIEAAGPMPVSDYMALCLFDPEHGYYTTREPFGASGDFTTAPEISQMFGELVAIWLYSAWQAAGGPLPVTLAEIGPGRGTLMRDMLRTLRRLDAGFVDTASVAMIETSPRLAAVQRTTLAGAVSPPAWIEHVSALPEGALLIVGNELFDALPIRQYVRTSAGWRERVVGLDAKGELAFMGGAGTIDPALLPPDAAQAPEGAVVEIAPARAALMDEIAVRISSSGGAGLFIDYGYRTHAVGDTLQALARHRPVDPLAEPGEADLTAHVDFAALTQAARSHGLAAHVRSQSDFLLAMGLVERAGRLGADRSADEQERIRGEVERLAGPQAMGELFKVVAVTAGAPLFPFGDDPDVAGKAQD